MAAIGWSTTPTPLSCFVSEGQPWYFLNAISVSGFKNNWGHGRVIVFGHCEHLLAQPHYSVQHVSFQQQMNVAVTIHDGDVRHPVTNLELANHPAVCRNRNPDDILRRITHPSNFQLAHLPTVLSIYLPFSRCPVIHPCQRCTHPGKHSGHSRRSPLTS